MEPASSLRAASGPVPLSGSEPAPAPGDVLIRSESGEQRYVVRQVPGVDQIATADREEALRVARSFARSAKVDVWYQDAVTRLLERYRS